MQLTWQALIGSSVNQKRKGGFDFRVGGCAGAVEKTGRLELARIGLDGNNLAQRVVTSHFVNAVVEASWGSLSLDHLLKISNRLQRKQKSIHRH